MTAVRFDLARKAKEWDGLGVGLCESAKQFQGEGGATHNTKVVNSFKKQNKGVGEQGNKETASTCQECPGRFNNADFMFTAM